MLIEFAKLSHVAFGVIIWCKIHKPMIDF